jgi:hypothetical protein
MRALVALTSTGALLLLLGGCTAILDAGRHQGGNADGGPRDSGTQDGGPRDSGSRDSGPPDGGCDGDGDGHLSTTCGGDDCNDADPDVYPNAPAICGNGRVEACPGSTVPAAHFGAASAGLLRPVELRPAGARGTELAVGVTRVGGSGFGTGVVLALEGGGAVRLDVPLNRLSDVAVVPVLDGMGNDLADAAVQAVALSRVDDQRLTAMYTGTGEYWYTVFDFVGGDRRAFQSPVAGLQPPAIVDGFGRIVRAQAGTTRTISWEISESAAAFTQHEGPEVPLGRLRTTPVGGWIMMQDPTSRALWTWEIRFGESVPTPIGLAAAGMAAFDHAAGERWVAWPREPGTVQIVRLDCVDGTCAPPGLLPGSEVLVRTGAPSVDVAAALTLPNGQRLALFIEHLADRDVLSAQPIGADLRVAQPRFRVLDTAGMRLLDARFVTATTDLGSTVFIVALAGDEANSRVLATGIRTCAMD